MKNNIPNRDPQQDEMFICNDNHVLLLWMAAMWFEKMYGNTVDNQL